MMQSIWNEAVKKTQFDGLEGDLETDVLIVGGGLAGILCAYMLQQAGVDYTLIEAKQICGGITRNTTAKVTVQHGLIYDKLIKKYGLTLAKQYYTANRQALEQYRQLCKDPVWGFETKDAYVYSLTDSSLIEKEVRAYEALGVEAQLVTDTSLPFRVAAAVRIADQGQLQPFRFLYRLSESLNIKENTKLVNLLPDRAETDKGTIRFRRAVLTTHFPILNKHGLYFLKMYQHRSYVVALEQAQDVGGMYVDADMGGLSFRNYDRFLLLGGGSHRTGKPGGGYDALMAAARRYYPDATVFTQFATQDCMSLDGIPYIGSYAKSTPNLFVATGFNKWGFTSAMAAARLLCDQLRGIKNENSRVFLPSRRLLHPQLAVNAWETAINLLTPTAPRCPHMGCALKYNRQEHTWDCPCHGSRFTPQGQLIDNPATDDK